MRKELPHLRVGDCLQDQHHGMPMLPIIPKATFQQLVESVRGVLDLPQFECLLLDLEKTRDVSAAVLFRFSNGC